MKRKLDNFSDPQWTFMAVLHTLNAPVPINVACNLVPISPSELIDLTQRAMNNRWFHKQEPDAFELTSKIPLPVQNRLRNITTPAFISSLVEKLREPDLYHQVSPTIRANLLVRLGKLKEAAFLEHEIGLRALRSGNAKMSLEYFDRAVDRLSFFLGNPDCDSLFVTAALELSHLRFHSGKRVGEVMKLLEKAKEAASRQGDRRSLTLIKLHMGRHAVMEGKPDRALQFFASGLQEVKEFGDRDISARAEEFSGLYHYLHGRFREAVENFEVALQRAELQPKRPRDFLVSFWLGFSSAYLGQVHHAIRILKSSWQRAWRESERALADNFRAALGMVLCMTGSRLDARTHLEATFKSCVTNQNHIGRFFSELGLAYCNFLESRPLEAYDAVVQAVQQASKTDTLLRQYTWPWFLEMLYQFHCLGYKPIIGFEFPEEIERILKGPNAHLRGVALRLQATEFVRTGGDPILIWADLEASEKEQKISGSSIELAKTWIEMARHKLRLSDPEEASNLALKAWERLSDFSEDFFPNDLKHLLNPRKPRRDNRHHRKELTERFLDIMEELVPRADLDKFLHRVLTATGKFFEAERGGIFWFASDDRNKMPLLRAAYNLTREEVVSDNFRSKLNSILHAYQTKGPLLFGSLCDRINEGGLKMDSALCIPFGVRGKACGLLYHDHCHLNECFGSLEKTMLERIARYLGSYIERIWDYRELLEEKALLTSKQSLMETTSDKWEIKFSSLIMKQLMDLTDRVANSEASVLITGETGVGKELLARRLHKMNVQRKAGPFVAIAITSIPETLLESELFGYEKGAFTGADHRKPGHLELANGGTLFIDEVADIPLNMQAKLLRVLQEKSFFRVGGTQALASDFRLVAATNRNIEEALLNGRFREDLYYRMNVVQLAVPPLRDRGKDVILLTNYLLNQYTKKYNCSPLSLAAQDEIILSRYPWPGNVRELKNVIERAVLLSTEGKLELVLPGQSDMLPNHPFADTPTMDELQRRYLRHVLEKTRGRIGGSVGAARILGMKRTTLYTRMKKLGLDQGKKYHLLNANSSRPVQIGQ